MSHINKVNIQARGTETEDSLSRRLEAAKKDMEYGDAPGNFDLGKDMFDWKFD